MPKFYATFGCGMVNAGRVIPINAADELSARKYMQCNYDNKYCGMYTETEWIAVKDKFKNMDMEYLIEKELPEVNI